MILICSSYFFSSEKGSKGNLNYWTGTPDEDRSPKDG